MKTIKISEATGPALDWLVAKALFGDQPRWSVWVPEYSTDWSQGGPIIDRERISIRHWVNTPGVHAYMPQDEAEWAEGPTPLIAAMRCLAISKLGFTIEVPEELL